MTVSDEGGVKTHDVPLANLESLGLLGGGNLHAGHYAA